MAGRLHDKAIVITGGGSGLGRALAARFVADVASAATFLASDEAAFISGVAFPIDGGHGAR